MFLPDTYRKQQGPGNITNTPKLTLTSERQDPDYRDSCFSCRAQRHGALIQSLLTVDPFIADSIECVFMDL